MTFSSSLSPPSTLNTSSPLPKNRPMRAPSDEAEDYRSRVREADRCFRLQTPGSPRRRQPRHRRPHSPADKNADPGHDGFRSPSSSSMPRDAPRPLQELSSNELAADSRTAHSGLRTSQTQTRTDSERENEPPAPSLSRILRTRVTPLRPTLHHVRSETRREVLARQQTQKERIYQRNKSPPASPSASVTQLDKLPTPPPTFVGNLCSVAQVHAATEVEDQEQPQEAQEPSLIANAHSISQQRRRTREREEHQQCQQDSQEAQDAPSTVVNARSIAQQRRRAREREEREKRQHGFQEVHEQLGRAEEHEQHQPALRVAQDFPTVVNARSVAQQYRRAREREERDERRHGSREVQQHSSTARQRHAGEREQDQAALQEARESSTVANARSIAQQRRRAREREERQKHQHGSREAQEHAAGTVNAHLTVQQRRRMEQREQHQPALPEAQEPAMSARSIAQRRRRAREREEREHGIGVLNSQQLPTPPSTQLRRSTRRGIQTPAQQVVRRTASLRASRAAPRQQQHSEEMGHMNVPLARRPYQEPLQRHDLGRMEYECGNCNALHWIDEKLASSSASSPVFTTCCDHGTVQLPPLQEPPQPLLRLFIGNCSQAKNFKEHIAGYNRALAFTSLGVKEDHTINGPGRGEPVFRIEGELCHRSGSLLPAPNQQPTYAQLYIYDPQSALQYRMEKNSESKLREDTMSILQDVIRENHQYAPVYMHAHEILQDQETDDVCIRLRVAPGTDRRRYNLPTAIEVAVILPGDQSRSQWRDIILRKRGGPLQRISECHPAYAPLQYVLLFPRGENGWYPELQIVNTVQRQKRKRVTLTRHTAYRLHDRRREFSCLLRGGRLLQRFIVDMWAAADQNKLHWLRKNQSQFRAHLSSGLTDAINNADGDVNLNDIGQRYVLPSSYTGGPRYMHQRFQDSMAVARHFKKVDLFLTMTCNPKWPEIQRELRPGETEYNRPDLVSRVFQMKKKALLKDILEEGVLGRVVAHVYSIEFQKRGLPHMHLLIFFDNPDKLLTPEEIDKLIWARWPDPETQPKLFETVKACMVHGPCGAANPTAPCMDPEKHVCTKHFPKPFCDATNMDVDGYPQYFRPDDGKAYRIGNPPRPGEEDQRFSADNRWIVPYCPFLSAKYDCHINVECAISLRSFKYVFKYIQKGGDRATMELYRQDEIKRWLDGRYVSASEASWRIFHFDLHDINPAVVRLQIHLPGQHMVVFDPNENPEDVQQRAANETTTLTAFFAANRDQGEVGRLARQLTYQDFPQYFVWVENPDKDGQSHYWKHRSRGFAVGRLYFVPPTGGERFYLRTLLTVVKGPTSFEDLRTYNGQVYPTFQEACLARGLLEDDGEWDQCLREASVMQTGTSLRQLFTTLLLFCDVSRPHVLWQNHRASICDDLRHRLELSGFSNASDDQVYDYGLYLLEKLLEPSGRSLSDYVSMPKPQYDWSQRFTNPLISEQLDYREDEQRSQLENRLPTLNQDQRSVYDHVIRSVVEKLGQVFFLNGPGGTGKTYVYNTICNKLRGDGLIVLAVASSGIASLLISGGRTAHSTFKIPIDGLSEESVCSIPKNSQRAELLQRTSLIIWDEAAAQHRYAIEAVDRTLRDIRNTDRPFGGVTVLFGGDYQQTLPVVPGGRPADIVHATLQRSHLWEDIKVLHLRENMRLTRNEANRQYAEWLLDIGHGRRLLDDGLLEIHSNMLRNSPDDLINSIYPNIDQSPPPPRDYFTNRMILAPRNSDVHDINAKVLTRMTGQPKTYFSADKIISDGTTTRRRISYRNRRFRQRRSQADQDSTEWGEEGGEQPIPTEVLRVLNDNSLPPGELTIKIGCPLILLRNLCPARGLCNGTRCIVTRADERVLEVQIMGGDHDGQLALIPRIVLYPDNSSAFAFNFRRRQFPVRLAFALSINKAQGQSVKYVGADLRNPVFSHGQLYVAFSRATSSDRVHVLLSGGSTTKNVVYPEVLLDG